MANHDGKYVFSFRVSAFLSALVAVCSSCLADDLIAPPVRHTDQYLSDLAATERDVTEGERTLKEAARTAKSSGLRAKQTGLTGSLQGLAEVRANAGDARGAISAFSQVWRYREQFDGIKSVGDEHADLLAIDTAHVEDAVEAIARAASSRQVVILNEAHHVPFDRILAMHLARALKRQGFEYLACETFFVDDEHVLANGYVVYHTGWYSREPTFAKFLMDAQSDGWKFVSYEPSTEPRESGMAKNLIKRVFAKNPKARVFIYAGYSHAMKVPVSHNDDDDSRLAAQLHRLTGIDPLTVNQTTLFEQYNSAQQARYYRHAVSKLRTRAPGVLMDSSGAPIKLSIDRFAYDFEVVHPAYVDDSATRRPEWLSKDFTPHAIPDNMIPTQGRRAIYAYLHDTEAEAVPLDVVILRPGGPVPKLMLPKGDYVLEYED
jgi:hypothetical protein